MKVVLFALNGSYSHTSLAVRAIGACLRARGTEPVIIEKNLKDTHLSVLQDLIQEKADLYGFSAYIWNIRDMLQFASEVKAVLPESKIVFGGPETGFETERYLREHPYIDYIIEGEGEESFPDLVEKLEKGESSPRIIMSMPYSKFTESGIYYDEIGKEPHGLVYYESVRGCPFSCAYCLSSVTDGIRAKPVEKALADLLLFEKFDDIKTVKLVDRTFNFSKERAKTMWRALSGPEYTKEYHFEISAALLDESCFEVLAKAPKGKFRLEIGVQSTNEKTIKAVARALDTKKTLDALRTLYAKHNLHLHADLIAGLPYEDYASFHQSFDDVYGICDVLQLGFLKLLKGSRMRLEAPKYGIVYSPYPPYEVLKTDFLSFDDIMRLVRIDALNDRFSNSGKFDWTFPYLPLATPSPFRFFEGLQCFFEEQYGQREITRLAQKDAFRLIFDYAATYETLDMQEVKERLCLDFLLGETRRVPDFLYTETLTKEEKEEILLKLPKERRAAGEAVFFKWLSDTPVAVDRIGRMIVK